MEHSPCVQSSGDVPTNTALCWYLLPFILSVQLYCIYFVRSLSPPFDTNNWPYTTCVTVKKTTFNPYLVSKQQIVVCWPSRESYKQTNQTYIRCIIPCWTTYTNKLRTRTIALGITYRSCSSANGFFPGVPFCAIICGRRQLFVPT